MVLPDFSQFPIQNFCPPAEVDINGWDRCIRCQKPGIKGTFYGRQKNYCSPDCLRSDNRDSMFRPRNYSIPGGKRKIVLPPMGGGMGHEMLTPLKVFPLTRLERQGCLSQCNTLGDAFKNLTFAPVDAFAHAPMSEYWKMLFDPTKLIAVDIKQAYRDFYWQIRLVKAYGYFIQIRYLGSNEAAAAMHIINFRYRNLYPLGQYYEENGTNYQAPPQLKNTTVVRMLQEAISYSTLNEDIHSTLMREITHGLDTSRFYEVVDLQDRSCFVPCRIVSSFGHWLLVKYEFNDNVVWMHPKTGQLRYQGWCQLVAHPIRCHGSFPALANYATTKMVERNQVNPLFLYEENVADNPFEVGMHLEVLDPFDHIMRVVSVVRKLRMGHMMVRLETLVPLEANPRIGGLEFCVHCRSPTIFPLGYSMKNKVDLYFSCRNKCTDPSVLKNFPNAAPAECFVRPLKPAVNPFVPGQVLEAFNVLEFGVVQYGVVHRVIERLVCVRFVGRDAAFGKWFDFESPSLLPFGYVNHIPFKENVGGYLKLDQVKFNQMHEYVRCYQEFWKEQDLKPPPAFPPPPSVNPSTAQPSNLFFRSTQQLPTTSASLLNMVQPLIRNEDSAPQSNSVDVQVKVKEEEEEHQEEEQLESHITPNGHLENGVGVDEEGDDEEEDDDDEEDEDESDEGESEDEEDDDDEEGEEEEEEEEDVGENDVNENENDDEEMEVAEGEEGGVDATMEEEEDLPDDDDFVARTKNYAEIFERLVRKIKEDDPSSSLELYMRKAQDQDEEDFGRALDLTDLDPDVTTWTHEHLRRFLSQNGFVGSDEYFSEKEITGSKFLEMTRSDFIRVTNLGDGLKLFVLHVRLLIHVQEYVEQMS